MLRRALASKQFALVRLENALEHFSTLRGFRVGNANAGNFEALFGVEVSVLAVDAQR